MRTRAMILNTYLQKHIRYSSPDLEYSVFYCSPRNTQVFPFVSSVDTSSIQFVRISNNSSKIVMTIVLQVSAEPLLIESLFTSRWIIIGTKIATFIGFNYEWQNYYVTMKKIRYRCRSLIWNIWNNLRWQDWSETRSVLKFWTYVEFNNLIHVDSFVTWFVSMADWIYFHRQLFSSNKIPESILSKSVFSVFTTKLAINTPHVGTIFKHPPNRTISVAPL